MTFSRKRLLAELLLKNMTTEQLADEIGISRASISSKMNGKTQWTLKEMHKVGELLGRECILPIFFA